MDDILASSEFRNPAISLSGTVDDNMYREFRECLATAPETGLVVVELSTLGGDPEVARMMGEDVRYRSEGEPARRFVFLGKAAIYSAGTTFMSFFALKNRYLTRGTRLFKERGSIMRWMPPGDGGKPRRLHERSLIKQVFTGRPR